MDAYDISMKIRQLWAEHYDRNSGQLPKAFGSMPVFVNGKKITDVVYSNGQIELKVEND